jgi:hypothetical protein
MALNSINVGAQKTHRRRMGEIIATPGALELHGLSVLFEFLAIRR